MEEGENERRCDEDEETEEAMLGEILVEEGMFGEALVTAAVIVLGVEGETSRFKAGEKGLAELKKRVYLADAVR